MTTYLQSLIDEANTEGADAGDFVKRLGGEEKVKHLIIALLIDQMENGGGGGVTDHGALTGLADDDHAQYHNDARGDARYYTEGESDALLAAKEGTQTAANQAEAEAGTEVAIRKFSPLRVFQAIAALSRWRTDAVLTFADPLALDANTVGRDDTRRVTATGNFTLPAPTNGAAGQRIRYHILASGGARTITLGSIVTPTDITFDGVIASGETRVIEIEKNGSAWWMTKNLQFA